MLNEIKEFEQYTDSLDTAEIRLKYRGIRNNLSGVTRAMTIVARKLYFDDQNPEGRISRVKDNLKAWCGDPKIINPGDICPEIRQNWLPDFIISVHGQKRLDGFDNYLNSEEDIKGYPRYQEICDMFEFIKTNFNTGAFRDKKTREQIMAFSKKITFFSKELGDSEADRRRSRSEYTQVSNILYAMYELNKNYGTSGYNKKMFNDRLEKASRNDFKKITYEKIVADAVAAGPLNRYYLVCEKENLFDVEYKNKKPFQKKSWSKATKGKEDLILKIVAAVLLGQRSFDAEEVLSADYVLINDLVPVNKTDIANWLKGNGKLDSMAEYSFKGKKLFESEDLKNVAAVGVDSAWMEDCRYAVIPENQLDAYLSKHQGAVFYSDPGAGKFLQKNIKYEPINN